MKTTLIVIQNDADHAHAKALIEKLMCRTIGTGIGIYGMCQRFEMCAEHATASCWSVSNTPDNLIPVPMACAGTDGLRTIAGLPLRRTRSPTLRRKGSAVRRSTLRFY
jgi:hypothetical protein